MGEFFHVGIKMPKGLDVMDFDRKIVMTGLKKASKIVQQQSKKLISAKGPSKAGEYPGRNTGRMRRHVRIKNSKRKDHLWSRVQVSTIEDSFFYPAVLNYGRKDGRLKPRKNPERKTNKRNHRQRYDRGHKNLEKIRCESAQLSKL